MKLVLTSAGFLNEKVTNAFLRLLSKQPKENSLIMIAYAQNAEEEFYINQSKKEVEKLGINVTTLNMGDGVDLPAMQNFDIVYVCGGNTFSILKKMRETGINSFIKKQVDQGAIYVGVSAGSIIAGPNIEIAGWGLDGDKNDVGLTDLAGFNFTDTIIFPHFVEPRHKQEVEEFKKKFGVEVQELTDEQALIITDSERQLV